MLELGDLSFTIRVNALILSFNSDVVTVGVSTLVVDLEGVVKESSVDFDNLLNDCLNCQLVQSMSSLSVFIFIEDLFFKHQFNCRRMLGHIAFLTTKILTYTAFPSYFILLHRKNREKIIVQRIPLRIFTCTLMLLDPNLLALLGDRFNPS